MENFLKKYFEKIQTGFSNCNPHQINIACKIIEKAAARGNKVLIFGNGGSAAIASHVSVDFTKAAGIRAVNFNEADLITCFANDYGYSQWIARAIEFFADDGDVIILISSSGNSANIVNGATVAKKMNCHLITLSGFVNDNPLRSLGEVNLWCDSSNYNVVETAHQIWLLAMVDFIAEGRELP